MAESGIVVCEDEDTNNGGECLIQKMWITLDNLDQFFCKVLDVKYLNGFRGSPPDHWQAHN
jgi:hypothetical protein